LCVFQAEEERRAQRKAREEQEEAERLKRKQDEKEQERLEREDEERRKKEREERELEEFNKWKSSIEVEAEGSAKAEQEEKKAKLAFFADHVKKEKVVLLEDLAITFSLQTQEVIDELTKAEDEGRLTGVIDERGKYIYISPEEMDSVVRCLVFLFFFFCPSCSSSRSRPAQRSNSNSNSGSTRPSSSNTAAECPSGKLLRKATSSSRCSPSRRPKRRTLPAPTLLNRAPRLPSREALSSRSHGALLRGRSPPRSPPPQDETADNEDHHKPPGGGHSAILRRSNRLRRAIAPKRVGLCRQPEIEGRRSQPQGSGWNPVGSGER
jgi:hypothetical protein